QVAPAHLDALARVLRPADRPLRDAAIAAQEVAIVPVLDVRDAVEARLDPLPDLLLAHEPPAAGSGPARHVQDAVLAEEGHDRVDVVGVERVEEGFEDRGGCVRAGHDADASGGGGNRTPNFGMQSRRVPVSTTPPGTSSLDSRPCLPRSPTTR